MNDRLLEKINSHKNKKIDVVKFIAELEDEENISEEKKLSNRLTVYYSQKECMFNNMKYYYEKRSSVNERIEYKLISVS